MSSLRSLIGVSVSTPSSSICCSLFLFYISWRSRPKSCARRRELRGDLLSTHLSGTTCQKYRIAQIREPSPNLNQGMAVPTQRENQWKILWSAREAEDPRSTKWLRYREEGAVTTRERCSIMMHQHRSSSECSCFRALSAIPRLSSGKMSKNLVKSDE